MKLIKKKVRMEIKIFSLITESELSSFIPVGKKSINFKNKTKLSLSLPDQISKAM